MFFAILPLIMVMGCASSGTPAATATNNNSAPAAAPTNNGSSGIDLDTAIKEAALQMDERLPGGTEVALVSLASSSLQLSEYIINRLEAALVDSRTLVVVDRANLDKVRAEQNLQLSGEISDESAKEVGQLLGAGAIVTGSFTNLGDMYILNLKAINMKTAAVAVSYPADIAKNTRIETLLAMGGDATGSVAASGNRPASGGTQAAPPPAQAPAAGEYRVGGTGPAGGLIFYSADSARAEATPPPVDGKYLVGNMGPASGVVFHSVALVTTLPPVGGEYRVGDTGPGGGIIFYINPQAGPWKYLEAAPAETEWSSITWSSNNNATNIAGTGVAIGTGKRNTETILRVLTEKRENDRAAQFCDSLEYGEYADWFLPSKDELNLMYTNLKAKRIGGFSDTLYWSSSQTNNIWNSWAQNFGDGRQEEQSKSNTYSVRAIRQF
jgi:hypothetical protein